MKKVEILKGRIIINEERKLNKTRTNTEAKKLLVFLSNRGFVSCRVLSYKTYTIAKYIYQSFRFYILGGGGPSVHPS